MFRNQQSKYLPWLACFSAALFFFYVVFQLTVFNTISTELMRDFSIQAPTLSKLSASYLYMASLFFLPAGLLFDRFSTRKLLISACLLCTLGTGLIAVTSSLSLAFLGRILVGISNPFAFLGPIRLVSGWFSSKNPALMIGFVVTIGMSGGIVSQSPFALLIQMSNWRFAMLLNAGLGILISLLLIVFVKDKPKDNTTNKNSIKLLLAIKQSFSNIQNWLCGFYAGLINLPFIVFGSLWGKLYLTQEKGLSAITAANLSSLILIGLMFGPAVMGTISDKLGKTRLPMIISAVLIILTTICIIYASDNYYFLAALFLIFGLLSGAKALSYPLVIKYNPPEVESTSLGLVSFLVDVIGAFSQIIFGWFISWHWNGKIINGIPIYSSFNFKFAFVSLLISFGICLMISFFIKDEKKRIL